MKRTTVTTLVANMRRAIARCLDRTSGKATRTDSQSHGTSRIGDSVTTGALCPDATEMTVRKQRLAPTLRSLFLSLQGVKRPGNPVGKATTGRNPLDCRVGPLGLLAMTRMVKASCSSSRLLGSIGSAFLIAGIVTMSTSLPAAEQDNWYLADEWSGFGGSDYYYSPAQVYYESNGSINGGRIYVADQGANKVQVFETNGTKLFEITGLSRVKGVTVDANGTIFCLYKSGLKSYDHNGTFKQTLGGSGSGDGQFNIEDALFNSNSQAALAIHPANGRLYAVDGKNSRVQVFDANGSFHSKFGTSGSAPGQLTKPKDLAFIPDGRLIVSDQGYLNYFDENGTFLNRVGANHTRVAVHKDGTVWTSDGKLRDADGTVVQSSVPGGNRAAFTPEGDLLITTFITGSSRLQIWKRAYRTKGLPTRNVIPQPAIRSIAQRTGTNIIDLDFEIVDPDDANATVGILAAKDGLFTDPTSWILPTAWVDGTGSKIGASIATNQVHRVSWNVKADWTEQTGTIKFEVFCQDARRNSPVDLHFLDLPLPDGNLTISRSPIKDSDFSNYFKYLLSTASSQVALENDKITDGNGTVLMETNLQASPAGKDFFMNAIGHRWAKQAELSLAREASTPGGINAWTATRQIQPRNLPDKVNEYGFDTGSHGARAWWVVKSSTLPIPEFTTTPFDINGTQNEYFGRRVALDGKHLFVGFNDGNKRKLHFYEISESNGSLTPKSIITPDSEANNQANYFGQAFAVDGDLLAVGARDAMESGVSNVGAVFLFDLNGTSPTQVGRITASDGTSSDRLGFSVDVSGNLIAAGAREVDVSGKSNVGAAYLFRKESNGSVTELAKLMHEDPQSSDYFGDAIAVGSSVVAVGAYQDDVLVSGSNKSNAGSVTLFKVDGAGNVTRAMTLTAPSPASNAQFGISLAISGDVLAVGELKRVNSQNYAGGVYLYKLNADGTAQLTASINSPTPTYQGYFGYSVALDGDRLAVGAYRENSETATKPGVAYVYKVKADGSATLLEVLTHPNGKQDDYLGVSVGVSGRNVVAGAYYFDPPPDKWNAGGAVLFRSSF